MGNRTAVAFFSVFCTIIPFGALATSGTSATWQPNAGQIYGANDGGFIPMSNPDGGVLQITAPSSTSLVYVTGQFQVVGYVDMTTQDVPGTGSFELQFTQTDGGTGIAGPFTFTSAAADGGYDSNYVEATFSAWINAENGSTISVLASGGPFDVGTGTGTYIKIFDYLEWTISAASTFLGENDILNTASSTFTTFSTSDTASNLVIDGSSLSVIAPGHRQVTVSVSGSFNTLDGDGNPTAGYAAFQLADNGSLVGNVHAFVSYTGSHENISFSDSINVEEGDTITVSTAPSINSVSFNNLDQWSISLAGFTGGDSLVWGPPLSMSCDGPCAAFIENSGTGDFYEVPPASSSAALVIANCSATMPSCDSEPGEGTFSIWYCATGSTCTSAGSGFTEAETSYVPYEVSGTNYHFAFSSVLPSFDDSFNILGKWADNTEGCHINLDINDMNCELTISQ